MKHLLVLASHLGPSSQHLANVFKDHYAGGPAYTLSEYSDLLFRIKNGKLSITEQTTGKDVADFSLVYFRTYMRYPHYAGAVADYLAAHHVPFIDCEVKSYHVTTKLGQYVRLSLAGLPVPDSIFAAHEQLASKYAYIASELGVPFVLKDIAAEQGNYNHLIHSQKEFDETMTARTDNPQYIAQKYIKAKDDIRTLVFGDKVAFAIVRHSIDATTHLHNTSKGAVFDELDLKKLDPEAIDASVRSAQLLERQVAGIDLIFDGVSKKWYILEVNNSPQYDKIFKIQAFGNYLKELMGA